MTTICIAEDNELDQRIIKLIVERYFTCCNLLFFNDGLAMLNYLKINNQDSGSLPDLILLDLSMQVFSRSDFLAALDQIKSIFSKCIQIYIVSVSINFADK